MLTIPIYLRFALMTFLFLGGLALSVFQNFWAGFPLILIAAILFIGYMLLGTVQSAAKLMQDGNFAACEKRLGLILSTKLLFRTNKAYYYLIKGSLAMQNKNLEQAENYFLKSQSIGLPSDNERAIVSLQLAGLHSNKQKWNSAKKYLGEAKKMKITEPQIKNQIDEFDRMFKQRGQMKHSQSGMMAQRGGKRKRPKMR